MIKHDQIPIQGWTRCYWCYPRNPHDLWIRPWSMWIVDVAGGGGNNGPCLARALTWCVLLEMFYVMSWGLGCPDAEIMPDQAMTFCCLTCQFEQRCNIITRYTMTILDLHLEKKNKHSLSQLHFHHPSKNLLATSSHFTVSSFVDLCQEW